MKDFSWTLGTPSHITSKNLTTNSVFILSSYRKIRKSIKNRSQEIFSRMKIFKLFKTVLLKKSTLLMWDCRTDLKSFLAQPVPDRNSRGKISLSKNLKGWIKIIRLNSQTDAEFNYIYKISKSLAIKIFVIKNLSKKVESKIIGVAVILLRFRNVINFLVFASAADIRKLIWY